ncbi:kinesin-like protein KIF13B [Polypterus senegalus]|uniref:kinesin-like protein KIF13B n=1 Tax=Polypterus senegalus TaxID=55291 RepID=UPI001962B850|nr:kinesin-like protein KIF13B [Polypterus senegalus]
MSSQKGPPAFDSLIVITGSSNVTVTVLASTPSLLIHYCLCVFSGQDVVFHCLGENLLQNAFNGYNACIFAYGQTGSGKSYTMMGPSDQPGLIPRLCSSLFQRTLQETEEKENFTVEVSYMEIYNEKVRDLLDPKGGQHSLKVREHKVLGPYVDGLSRLAVTSCKDIESLMSEGNKSRTVAATNMNEESSRSHAVFNIILTHTIHDLQSGTSGEKVSKLSLVDLAGSERATKTGAVGERLKEGSNINKSLTTLGLVISALSDHSTRKNKFIPYRDSVLTWLLKDSLGGNSKTAMIATVSPAADSYDETLSTLRYADRAKHIVNHAVVNEDPNARIIRQLREEVEKLREQLTEAESLKAPELKDRLEESEKLFKEMTVTWEDKLRKTEEIAQERQKQLESLGISLQSSGIRVGEDKSFLVNLNADPALSELLVYYLKEHTLVGSADSQDIQLCGMGIQDEHCTIDITGDGQVVLSPNENARTCVNGSIVNGQVFLHHGDRILWGNNHFFRINLPKQRRHLESENEEDTINCSSSSGQLHVDGDNTNDHFTDTSFSYESAQMEVMMKALGKNEPVQSILWSLEQHHEEEKQSALERQRIMYEQELEYLRRHITRHDQPKYHSMERLSTSSSSLQQRLQWNEEREELLRVSLRKLKEQIVRANLLVQEASFIAQDLEKKTEYYVTLQIPASNLNANKKWDAVLSEPAVHVRRMGKSKQIWALEKLENRLVDMRELYQEWKNFDDENPVMHSYLKRADPFFDEEENHTLIGVANVFLSCLFYDVKFQYAVPIISQKGEMVGRLHVELFRVSENMQERLAGGETSENTDENVTPQKTLVCVIRILQATGLPHFLSKFVFCKYCFWGQLDPTSVAPEVDTLNSSPTVKDLQSMVVFDHSKTFSVASSEDFIEYLTEGALAIEVYGHKQTSLLNQKSLALWDLGIIQAKTRTFRDRWSELTRKVEMWIHILEQDENGDYVAVEVVSAKGVCTGGIFQLKQGLSRRIQVHVRSVQDSGTMPLIIKSILSISVGSIEVHQRKPQKGFDSHQTQDDGLDSYQDRDLERLRQQWLIEWTKRQDYLDQHLQKLVNKSDKSENDTERECQLLERRLTLIEERNAVMVPSEGSGIPGAPAKWIPAPGMETHIPVLFLDLSESDLRSQENLEEHDTAAWNSTLAGEIKEDFFELQIVKNYDGEIKSEASWDSAVHSCPQLSRGTATDQHVYLIVKAVVQLSHPANKKLLLRKRICVNVTGKQSFTQSFLRMISQRSTISGCGVTFELVSNIPEENKAYDDGEMLAQLATKSEQSNSADTEAALEKYLRSVLSVENILTLDRLRQEVAVKEHNKGMGKHNRRSHSSPNVHKLSGSHMDLFPNYRLEDKKVHWESQQNVSTDLQWSNNIPSAQHHSRSPEECSGIHAAAASLLSQQKPSMPKLMKSLFPIQTEKKRLTTSSLLHQAVKGKSLANVNPSLASAEEPLNHGSLEDQGSHHSFQIEDYPGNNCSKTTHSEESIVKKNFNILPDSRFLSNMCTLSDKIKPSHQSNTLVKFNTEANLKTNISPQKDTSEVTKMKTSYISNCKDIGEKETTNHCQSLPHQIQGISQSNLPTTSPFKITKVKTSGLKSFSLILGEDLTQSGHSFVPDKLHVKSERKIDSSLVTTTENFQTVECQSEVKTEQVDKLLDVSNCHSSFVPDWLKRDVSVTIGNNKKGKVCYIGPTEFAEGIWVGVELEVPAGKNDGFDAGKQYFKCKPGHGVLVRPDGVNQASCPIMQQSKDSTHTSV